MNSPNIFLDIWNFNSTSLFWFFEMDLLKMTLIILSDSDTVIPNFLEETHRTCVLVSWTQDFFKLKYVISGFTVDLRLVEPFGVYALICFLAQNNFVRFGWYRVTRGSPKLVFAAITRSNFDPRNHVTLSLPWSWNWCSISEASRSSTLDSCASRSVRYL